MKADVLAVATCLAAGAAVLSAATIREIKLANGSDEANQIVQPIYDTSGIPPVIGGPEANRLVTTLGVKDKDTGPRRLATRIAAKPPK